MPKPPISVSPKWQKNWSLRQARGANRSCACPHRRRGRGRIEFFEVMESSFQEVVTGRGSSLLADSASAESWFSKQVGQSSLSLSNSLEATSASHCVQVRRQSLQQDSFE